MGPRQRNKEFYVQQYRTLFGLGIHYLDKDDDQIKIHNVDIVSQLSTDADAVVRCIRFLRNQYFFKKIEKPTYIIWVDCGPHFRNGTIMHYFFEELASLTNPIVVNLNFLGEKHGKNSRDTHFSVLSKKIFL